MHTSSVTIFPKNYDDCTLFQQHFLALMAAEEINLMTGIDTKLKAIADVLGVKFKE